MYLWKMVGMRNGRLRSVMASGQIGKLLGFLEIFKNRFLHENFKEFHWHWKDFNPGISRKLTQSTEFGTFRKFHQVFWTIEISPQVLVKKLPGNLINSIETKERFESKIVLELTRKCWPRVFQELLSIQSTQF